MIKKILKKKKSTIRLLFIYIVTILVLYTILSPYLYQKIGNVFFGRVPPLYNLNLATFFFTYAAYPILGIAAPYAHHQLSRTYFIRGNLDVALAEAKKELEVHPDHVATYYILGLTYGYMNREKEAIEAFSSYIDTHPESWAARNDKAWLQFRTGDIDGALTTIEPAATSNSINNPWVQNTYGTLLMNKKKYTEARDAFARAEAYVSTMTEASWGNAYPGNDPRIYATGLASMKSSIQSNQKLVNTYLHK
jgi:tetratricopeptide (TPR) repeat protein